MNLGDLVVQLTGDARRREHGAHLDPDLVVESYPRNAGWRPLFGQTRAAQGHLRNQGIQAGDLFLFFGLFREVEETYAGWKFVARSRAFHAFWGWLHVSEIIKVREIDDASLPWARYHPHFYGDRGLENTIYLASDRFRFQRESPEIHGSGVFSTLEGDRILSSPDHKNVSLWRLPACFVPGCDRPPLSYHADESRWQLDGRYVLLQSVARGQEFVLDLDRYPEVMGWVERMLSGVPESRSG